MQQRYNEGTEDRHGGLVLMNTIAYDCWPILGVKAMRAIVERLPTPVFRLLFSMALTYKMVRNLAWAVGYNAIALPLAAGVLAGIGFVLSAWVGTYVSEYHYRRRQRPDPAWS